MLSILIPAYCWNVFPLVKKLHKQLVLEDVSFEIIVIDDASKDESIDLNEKINSLSNSTFEVLENNIGRSAIRNLLASKAQYEWVLFFDADVMIYDNKFIQNYLKHISGSYSIILGGLNYLDEAKGSLRFNFGIKREVVPYLIRNKEPYRYFFASNLLIRKNIFETIVFNEKLSGHGYEDILFSLELKESGLLITHIDNPVFHLGVDSNEEYVRKIKEGLNNLNYLLKKKWLKEEEIKLVYLTDRFSFIMPILNKFQNTFESLAIRNSSLFFFDLFRMSYLYNLLKKKR